jgi:putative N-acetylmannosamine-6-phosphate epimerase
MRPAARTPEELETLLEDAFVVRNGDALAELFEDGAVLVADDGTREARGGQEIARLASQMWERNHTYLADPRRVLQARNTALIITKRGVNVVRRGSDGAWRYAIAVLSQDGTTIEEDQWCRRRIR